MLQKSKIDSKRAVQGLTMIEVMITVGILVVALLGFLRLFMYCSQLAQTARNLSFAVNDAQVKLEEMRYYNFDRLAIDYAPSANPGDTFNLSQLDGMGKIYLTPVGGNPEVLQVDIVVSYRGGGNHLIGEDDNFNGSIDGPEDVNGNNRLDSPAAIVSYISKR
ncbi:MAG: hypothetical protein JW869_03860 [Candidatus Omnitrophica bacterium]|nr:hypothetical protein [Candidatus Omnitrophota bacterium]